MVGPIELAEQPVPRINAVIDAHPAGVRIGQAVQLRIVALADSGFRSPEFVSNR